MTVVQATIICLSLTDLKRVNPMIQWGRGDNKNKKDCRPGRRPRRRNDSSEKATGTDQRHRPLTQMLPRTKVQFKVGWVSAIDARQQCLYFDPAVGEDRTVFPVIIQTVLV